MNAASSSHDAYASKSATLNALGTRLIPLISDLLDAKSLRVHSVTFRVKTRSSAETKVEESAGKYRGLDDLHDLLGVRIITHLASEVRAVADLLAKEFEVDGARSSDRVGKLDVDQFGYRSHHLVASVGPPRRDLDEWRSLADLPFEVQVRSLLQHTWAEIEHDLGYKSAAAIPEHMQRRFARLAGLLELADDEFDRISGEMLEHVRVVAENVEEGNSVAIDRDAVVALTRSSVVRTLDRRIADGISLELQPDISVDMANTRAEELRDVYFSSTEQVVKALENLGDSIVEFAIAWFTEPDPYGDSPDNYASISPGISLFYLYLHRLTEEDELFHHLDNFSSIGRDGPERFLQVHDAAFDIEKGD